MSEERLQKVMAAAGVGSRRACEQLILAGKVRVNGQLVTELGAKVDPAHARIVVDGKPVKMPQRHMYLKVYKPRGVLGDIGDDPEGRQTVLDLVPSELSRRVFPVGRLDFASEGLMLLTDDGALAHRLTHPRFQHPKTYYVLVDQRPSASALAQFRTGIELEDGLTAPAEVRIVRRPPPDLRLGAGPESGVWLEVILREGKKRQIRHMTAAIGHPTLRLIRAAIGPLTLGSLKAGETKPLTRTEVGALRQMVAESSSKRESRNPTPFTGRASRSSGERTNPTRRPPTGRARS